MTTSEKALRSQRLNQITHEPHSKLDALVKAHAPFETQGAFARFVVAQYLFQSELVDLYNDTELNKIVPDLAERCRAVRIRDDELVVFADNGTVAARLRLIVLLILGFGERNPGLTRILTGHALMFEQDRLQGRINQLFERIEAQLRQVMREKKMREGEGYTLDETLLASQLLAFCEGMLSRFVRSEFKYRPTDDFEDRKSVV